MKRFFQVSFRDNTIHLQAETPEIAVQYAHAYFTAQPTLIDLSLIYVQDDYDLTHVYSVKLPEHQFQISTGAIEEVVCIRKPNCSYWITEIKEDMDTDQRFQLSKEIE